jgi:hypothetical protein
VLRRVAIVAMLAACDKGSSAPPAPAIGSGSATCVELPFAASTPVPEASGAAWLDGKLVVVSDSGNHGAYGIVDPETGTTVEQGTLPLGPSTDDLEGLDARDGVLYGITSPGWILTWKRTATGFELADGPYALGPVDLPPKSGVGDKPPKDPGMVCDANIANCGRNYEGLCLRPRGAAGDCTGYALSKADGHLYCLTEHEGRLAIHKDRAIAVDRPGVVADCAFAPDGTLWAGNNLFGMSQVFRVDEAHATVASIGPLGTGFPEVLAVRGDVIFRMSDTGGSPSLMAKFRCTGSTR